MDRIATAEAEPTPLSEDEMGTHLSRLVRPFLLAAPLMLATLLPAAVYGQRSNDVAAEADRELVRSFVPSGEGAAVTLDPELLCNPGSAASLPTTFAEINLDGDNHKASVSGLGFESVNVDFEGRIDALSRPGSDNITVRLERTDGDWCVADVTILGADPG